MATLALYLPAITLAATIGAGLMAGLFFAFSTFIMQALSRIPPEQGMAAMQQINVAVINPLFAIAFFGTALLCLVVIGLVLVGAAPASAALLLAGTLLYLVGVIGVTMAFNVPLNNALAATAATQAAEEWPRYVAAWLRWNHVRTVASVLSLACLAWSLYRSGH